MKRRDLLNFLRSTDEHIAQFGEAELVRRQDGRCEIRGGTLEDRRKAVEWVAMFLPKAKFDPPPRSGRW